MVFLFMQIFRCTTVGVFSLVSGRNGRQDDAGGIPLVMQSDLIVAPQMTTFTLNSF